MSASSRGLTVIIIVDWLTSCARGAASGELREGMATGVAGFPAAWVEGPGGGGEDRPLLTENNLGGGSDME